MWQLKSDLFSSFLLIRISLILQWHMWIRQSWNTPLWYGAVLLLFFEWRIINKKISAVRPWSHACVKMTNTSLLIKKRKVISHNFKHPLVLTTQRHYTGEIVLNWATHLCWPVFLKYCIGHRRLGKLSLVNGTLFWFQKVFPIYWPLGFWVTGEKCDHTTESVYY